MSPAGGGHGAWKVFHRLHALVMASPLEGAAPVIFNYLRRRHGRLSVKSQQRRLFPPLVPINPLEKHVPPAGFTADQHLAAAPTRHRRHRPPETHPSVFICSG